jgi:hypothetical protein
MLTQAMQSAVIAGLSGRAIALDPLRQAVTP